jgi:hypothetical protein
MKKFYFLLFFLLLMLTSQFDLNGQCFGVQTYTAPGAQVFTIPGGPGDIYTIEIETLGADGGDYILNGNVFPAGTGANMKASFIVNGGDELLVMVGESGSDPLGNPGGGGGGGGTGVVINNTSVLIASGAGGGGGGNNTGQGAFANIDSPAEGGAAPGASGGGGFNADGADGINSTGGGAGTLTGIGLGGSFGVVAGPGGDGFGGGGGGAGTVGGGGGGYKGGDGGDGGSSLFGKGGDSFINTAVNSGTVIFNTPGLDASGVNSDGYVIITCIPAGGAVQIMLDSQTNPSCFGSSDGQIDVSAFGGAIPYQYSIDGGAFGSDDVFTGLSAGTYTLSVMDGAGAFSSMDVTLVNPPQLGGNIVSQTNVSCFGEFDGAVTVSGSGGTSSGNYSYAIDGGLSTANSTFSGLTVGPHTVTITDDNDCTFELQVNITAPDEIAFSFTNLQDITCFGANDGSVSGEASGGSGGFTYSTDGVNFQDDGTFDDLEPGFHTVVVMDQNDCFGYFELFINEPEQLELNVTQTNHVSCNGAGDGSITVSGAGGTTSYIYAIDNGQPSSDNTFTNLIGGDYFIQIFDANDCTTSTTVTITEPDELSLSVAFVTNSGCGGEGTGAVALLPAGGTSDYTFTVDGESNMIGEFLNLSAGTFTATVTDDNDCTAEVEFTIEQEAGLGLAVASSTNVSCTGGTDGEIEVIASGGEGAIQYSINEGDFQDGNVFSGLSAGDYSITAQDENGCANTVMVTITEPDALEISINSQVNVDCYGNGTGSISLTMTGGTAGYMLSYEGNNITLEEGVEASIADLVAGTYILNGVDQNECTVSDTIIITEPDSLELSIVETGQVTCPGNLDGSISVQGVGGVAPYIYAIEDAPSDTINVFTGLSAGTYLLSVLDANGCVNSTSVILLEPDTLSLSVLSTTDPLCMGESTGTVMLASENGVAPVMYSLNDETNDTGSFSGLPAGTYTASVSDGNGCSAEVEFEIGDGAQITLTEKDRANVSCAGGDDGMVEVLAEGGAEPYQYTINDGDVQDSNVFEGLTAGEYTITAQDANGCSASITVVITEPDVLLMSILDNENVDCNGNSTGSVTIVMAGGNPGYTVDYDEETISLEPGIPATITDLAAGTYIFVGTDQNGCLVSDSIIITQPDSLTLAVTESTMATCSGISDGSITVEAGGGTSPYTYALNDEPAGDSNVFAGLSSGSYTVVVTDANGCTQSVEVTITDLSLIILSVESTTNSNCSGDAIGSVTLSAEGGEAPYTYSLGDETNDTGIFGSLAPGDYTALVTDANGCSGDVGFTIDQGSEVVISLASTTNVSCAGGSDGEIEVEVSGGSGVYMISIDGGTFSDLSVGTYTITVEDSEGCTASLMVTITEPDAIVTTIENIVNVDCNGAGNGSAELTISGGTPLYTVVIGMETMTVEENVPLTISGLAAGDYSLEVTDQNGCTETVTFTITEPVTLVLELSDIQNVTCNGENNGFLFLTASGGTPGDPGYILNYFGEDLPIAEGVLVSIGGLATAEYTFDVVDENGCLISETIEITEPEPLTLEITEFMDNDGSMNGSITVVASGGTEPYQYSIDGGITFQDEPVFEGLEGGEFFIIVEDANGCEADVSQTITGLNEIDEDKVDLEIYPIPVSEVLNIRVTLKDLELKSLTILDVLGRTVDNAFDGVDNTTHFEGKINTTNLPEGTYMIKIETTGGYVVKRFVVVH